MKMQKKNENAPRAGNRGGDIIQSAMVMATLLNIAVPEQPEGDAQHGVNQNGGQQTEPLQPAYRGYDQIPDAAVDEQPQRRTLVDDVFDRVIQNVDAGEMDTLQGTEVGYAADFMEDLQMGSIPVSQASTNLSASKVSSPIASCSGIGNKKNSRTRASTSFASDDSGSEFVESNPRIKRSCLSLKKKTPQGASPRDPRLANKGIDRRVNRGIEATPSIPYKLQPIDKYPLLRGALTCQPSTSATSSNVAEIETVTTAPEQLNIGGKSLKSGPGRALPGTSANSGEDSVAVQSPLQRRSQDQATDSDSSSDDDFEKIFSQVEDRSLFVKANNLRRRLEKEWQNRVKELQTTEASIRSKRQEIEEFEAEVRHSRELMQADLEIELAILEKNRVSLNKARTKMMAARKATNFKHI